MIVITFPLPGYAAKAIQHIQTERLKKVSGVVTPVYFMRTESFTQTDARVQTVTEGVFILHRMRSLSKSHDSLGRSENDKAVWMGTKYEAKN